LCTWVVLQFGFFVGLVFHPRLVREVAPAAALVTVERCDE
jgi:hypothetical protein